MDAARLDEAVNRQLPAYNARDVDAFAACFAEDVVILDADGKELARGREALRDRYATLFEASPDLHADVVARIRVDRFVVDEEKVSGTPKGTVHAIAIYRLAEDGLIERVQFLM